MKTAFSFKPNRCVLELTYACNLRCRTCTIWTDAYKASRMHTKHYLGLNRLKKLQRSLAAAGIKRITYLGGEPFLKKELLPLAAHAQSRGISTAVVTNGTCLNQSIIQRIIKRKIFDVLIFSLDGPPAVHDRIRGVPGTFQRTTTAIKAIQKLKKARKIRYPKIFIYVTVSCLNHAYVESMLEIARELDVQAIRFISASCLDTAIIRKTNALFNAPVINCHSYAVGPGLKIPPQELPLLRKRLARMGQYAKKIGKQFQVEAFLKNGKGASSCFLIGKDFVISAFGDVYPCPMLPGYTFGNIADTPIDTILRDSATEMKVERVFKLCARKKLPVCLECCVEKTA